MQNFIPTHLKALALAREKQAAAAVHEIVENIATLPSHNVNLYAKPIIE